jgi:toxin ParE1/3/4
MAEGEWRVRLGATAELDFANILRWTTDNFGMEQARNYRDTLTEAIAELANGPDIAGTMARDDIMAGLRTLHVARHGRRGRHFLYSALVDAAP